jgi:hypothetical protein
MIYEYALRERQIYLTNRSGAVPYSGTELIPFPRLSTVCRQVWAETKQVEVSLNEFACFTTEIAAFTCGEYLDSTRLQLVRRLRQKLTRSDIYEYGNHMYDPEEDFGIGLERMRSLCGLRHLTLEWTDTCEDLE